MLQNQWKSALICAVAICGSSFLAGQEGNGEEKPIAILRTAGDYVLVQRGGGGHGGGGHGGGGHGGGGHGGHVGGGGHMGGGSAMHNGGAMRMGGGSALHNGGAMRMGGGSAMRNSSATHNMGGGSVLRNGGGIYHSGVNANRAPVGTHHAAAGTHWGSGTGIQMSHGNAIRGYRGSNAISIGSHHANTGNHQFTGNNFHLNNHRVSLGSNHYQPSYYNHNRYHGYWNGNHGHNGVGGYRHTGYGRSYGIGPYYGIYGNGYGWGLGYGYGRGYGYRRYGYGYSGYYPFGWGLGGWGLGSLYYSSGYLGYSNPYYYGYDSTCYNYAQPIPVAYNNSATVVESTPATGVQNSAELVMNTAVAAFQQNNFDIALDAINTGITQYPADAVLHEFRALVLFAKADYQQAAATIHSVLAVGPGWDWSTLSRMYLDVAAYTDQLRALEAFTKSHPDDAAGHFLLSYHYLCCGHTEAAARHLQTTVTLVADDKVAADILRMIQAPDAAAGDPASPPALPPLPVEGAENQETQTFKPEVAPVDPKTLIGSWKASRSDGSSFVLTITDDAKFTWSFAQKDQAPKVFGGTYTIDGNVLALERKDGGALIGEITPGDSGKLNFRMLGADDADKGLDFEKP